MELDFVIFQGSLSSLGAADDCQDRVNKEHTV